MLRAAVLAILLCVACVDDGHTISDGNVADPPIGAVGSGSGAMMAMEATPRDNNLNLVVMTMGIVIVAAPAGYRRRRRTAR